MFGGRDSDSVNQMMGRDGGDKDMEGGKPTAQAVARSVRKKKPRKIAKRRREGWKEEEMKG